MYSSSRQRGILILPRRTWAAVAMSALTVMGVTACGLVGGNSSGTSSSAKTWRVGVVAPLTGSEAAPAAGMVQAIELATDQANASGGVLGRKIQLVKQDDACDATTGANAANKLVQQQVKAVVGSFCSGPALVMEPIFARNGIPFVIAGADSPELVTGKYSNIAQSVGDYRAEVPSMNYLVTKTLKVNRIGVADDQSAFAKGIAGVMTDGLRKSGVTVDRQSVSAQQNDFSAVLNSFAGKDQAILWTGYYAQAVNLIKQLRQSGSKVPLIVTDAANVPSYIQGAGAQAEGTWATSSPATSYFSTAKNFVAAYTKKYAQPPDTYAVLGYDGMNSLIHAAKKVSSTDGAKLIDGLHQVDFTGATGPISFEKSGRRNIAVFPITRVRAGTWVLADAQVPQIAQFLKKQGS